MSFKGQTAEKRRTALRAEAYYHTGTILSRQNLIAMIDAAMVDYPEFGEIKNERATTTIGWITEYELTDEDWARVRTALETAIKQK